MTHVACNVCNRAGNVLLLNVLATCQ
jgi:hypothetical protein